MSYNRGLVLSALGLLIGANAFAANPVSFSYQGQLLTASGAPSTDTVGMTLQILSPDGSCVLYEQHQPAANFTASQGNFTVQVGTPVSSPLRGSPGDAGLSMVQVFSNQALPIRAAGPANCPAGYTPSAGDIRLLRVTVIAADGTADVLSPDQVISSAPFALSAETLQGLDTTDLINVKSDATNALTQANAEYIFTNLNYAKLKAMVDGTSTQYLAATPSAPLSLNSEPITNVANPINPQDAATKMYTDTTLGGLTLSMAGIGVGVGGGKTLVWDQVVGQWTAQAAAGSVVSVSAGAGLLGGTITSAGSLSVDVGTTASKIVQLNASAQLPAVDGSLLVNVSAGKLQGRNVSAAAPAAGNVLTWNSSLNTWDSEATAGGGGISALTGDVTASGTGSVVSTIANNAITAAKINNTGIAVNRLLITDATTGTSVGYATCAVGQVLQWSATGWTCTNVATVLGTPGTGVNTQGSSTQVPVVSVDAQGRVTSLTNMNIAFPVTSVVGRTGAVTLTAADIAGLGTASLQNYGTGANSLVQLNASAQLPAVDGSLLTNINSTNTNSIHGVAVSATAPSAGQVLTYNATSGQWQALAPVTSGTVMAVTSGVGLVAGTITSTGSINVDVGTAANKIVQLTSTGKLPAVDGSMLTNVSGGGPVNNLQSRTVSAAAPAGGQVLGWNATTVQWEPSSTGGAGTVTTVTSGVGLVAGSITSSGVINVDVGTAPNKIIQLNAAAQLPAVDGSLLTNINSTNTNSIHGVAVSATAPSAGQVLTYNATSGQWQALAPVTSGTVMAVTSGVGLVAGTITSTGSINVDVGTAANKIVQLTSTGKLPAVDGSMLTNVSGGGPVNNLQSRTVSAAAPAGGQVLGWNATTAQWEPSSTGGAGTVTTVTSGVGLVAGSITSSGVINVDVGTAPNKIIQLNAAAQLPAVDGSLLTNINPAFVAAASGSAVAPSLTFAGNSGTGIYSPAPNVIAVSTNGSERLRVDPFGNVGIGTASPIAPLTVFSTNTATNGNSNGGIMASMNYAPGASPSAGTSVQGLGSQVSAQSATSNSNVNLSGVSGSAGLGTSTTVGSLVGMQGSASVGSASTAAQGMVGVQAAVSNSSSTMSSSSGAAFSGSLNNNSGANLQYGYGSLLSLTNQGTMTDYSGIQMNFSGSGAIGNVWGLYINTLPTGAASKFGVYVVDPTASNYFAGNVGVGIQNPTANLHVAGTSGGPTALQIDSSIATGATSQPVLTLNNFGSTFVNSGSWPAVRLNNSRGFQGTPSALQAGDTLSTIEASGYGGSSYAVGGRIAFLAEQNFATGSYATGVAISTTPAGSSVATERMRISSMGNVGIGTTTPMAALDVGGHVGNSGAAASVTTCGTGASIIGNDTRGVVTLGTGSPTTCSIQFAMPYMTAPFCVITPAGGNPGSGLMWWVGPTITSLVINFSSTPTTSQKFQYFCMQ